MARSVCFSLQLGQHQSTFLILYCFSRLPHILHSQFQSRAGAKEKSPARRAGHTPFLLRSVSVGFVDCASPLDGRRTDLDDFAVVERFCSSCRQIDRIPLAADAGQVGVHLVEKKETHGLLRSSLALCALAITRLPPERLFSRIVLLDTRVFAALTLPFSTGQHSTIDAMRCFEKIVRRALAGLNHHHRARIKVDASPPSCSSEFRFFPHCAPLLMTISSTPRCVKRP